MTVSTDHHHAGRATAVETAWKRADAPKRSLFLMVFHQAHYEGPSGMVRN